MTENQPISGRTADDIFPDLHAAKMIGYRMKFHEPNQPLLLLFLMLISYLHMDCPAAAKAKLHQRHRRKRVPIFGIPFFFLE